MDSSEKTIIFDVFKYLEMNWKSVTDNGEGHCPSAHPLYMPLLRYMEEKIDKNLLVINVINVINVQLLFQIKLKFIVNKNK